MREFSPPIYVSGARDDLKRLSSDLWRRGFVTGGRWEKRRELWTGEEIEVLRLNVYDSSNLSSLREIAGVFDQTLSFYNLDIPTAQYYLYLSGLFPLCRLECEADELGNVIEIVARNSAYITRLISKGCWNSPGLLNLPCSGPRDLCGISANFKYGNV